jgi:hypothetical protein
MTLRLWVAVAAIGACAHAAPTITGAQVYALLPALGTSGQAEVGTVRLHRGQYLVADATSQVLELDAMISQCNGEGVERDQACALAPLQDLSFRVTEAMPSPREHAEDGGHLSVLWKIRVAALVVAAPLTVGLLATSFPGHEAVFGIPLGLDACALLFTLGRD